MIYSQRGAKYSALYCGGFRLPRTMSRATRKPGLPYYQQLDRHCCGLVAALAVLEHHGPIDHAALAGKLRPCPDFGVHAATLHEGLQMLGNQVRWHTNLSLDELIRLVWRGAQVIVGTRGYWTGCEHWAAVAGVQQAGAGRVFLNGGLFAAYRGYPFSVFQRLWQGECLVVE